MTGGMVDELDDDEVKMFSGEAEAEPTETPTEADAPEDAPVEPQAEPEGDAPEAEASGEAPPAEGEQPPAEEDEDDNPLEGDLNGNKGRFVRHGAFHRQRMRANEFKEKWEATEAARQQEQAELNQLRQEMARASERLSLLMQVGQSPGEQQPQQPELQQIDPEAQPFAYMQALGQKLQQIEQGVQGQQALTQEQQEFEQLKSTFANDARAYMAEVEDFPQAYQHLLMARDKELSLIGVSPEDRAEQIKVEEAQLVQAALQQGRRPSELFYQLATDRGYTKAEPPAPEPAPAPEPTPAPTASEVVEQKAKAAAETKSLSSAGGSGAQVLTAEALANMPEDEFNRVYEKLTSTEKREYFGG